MRSGVGTRTFYCVLWPLVPLFTKLIKSVRALSFLSSFLAIHVTKRTDFKYGLRRLLANKYQKKSKIQNWPKKFSINKQNTKLKKNWKLRGPSAHRVNKNLLQFDHKSEQGYNVGKLIQLYRIQLPSFLLYAELLTLTLKWKIKKKRKSFGLLHRMLVLTPFYSENNSIKWC